MGQEAPASCRFVFLLGPRLGDIFGKSCKWWCWGSSNQEFPLYSQTDAENLGSDEHMAQFKCRDWILAQESPGMELELPSHRRKIMLFRGIGEICDSA